MKAFAALYRDLDATTSSLAKQAALQEYLRAAAPADAAWAVYFLAGGKPRQLVATRALKQVARDAAGLPEWLFDESYDAVGDLAETIALLLPPPNAAHDLGLAAWVEQHLLPLRKTDAAVLPEVLLAQWQLLDVNERLVYFKLITGGFRVGVSRLQVTTAVAAVGGLDPKLVAQRMMGYTHIGHQPQASDYLRLLSPEAGQERDRATSGQPYPFFLAHPMNLQWADLERTVGPRADWLVEWKWDGIRAQVVCRAGQAWIWSRGEELVSDRFPELQAMAAALPDGTVIDGEIVVWRSGGADNGANTEANAETETETETGTGTEAEAETQGRVQPFAELQRRIGRKTIGPKLQREIPVVLLAYDLLEFQGQDLRAQPQQARRALLDALLLQTSHPALRASPLLQGESWQALGELRESARARGVEGMMLKARSGQYGTGRTKDVGTWWKWKIDPLSIDAVLIYAQRGHGRRANLYSDYTFAVWDGPEPALKPASATASTASTATTVHGVAPADPAAEPRKLVPFAKAYSGLTDEEMARVDAIIRRNTVESFGPVRSVKPTLVFELGFEGIARSKRHKSGIAVRFPRMLRWREDKPVQEADTLQTLSALLPLADG